MNGIVAKSSSPHPSLFIVFVVAAVIGQSFLWVLKSKKMKCITEPWT